MRFGSGGPGPARWGLLVAACCLVLLALGPVYDTDDDPAMIEMLSGMAGGRALDAPYLGVPLSAALRGLYAAVPAVPWYGLVMEACNVFSAGLWAALIASCQARPAARLAATSGLLVAYSYLVLRVNFMAASFSLFLAATAWLWKLQIEQRAVQRRQLWLGVAMGLGYLIRPSLLLLLLFFALPCLGVSFGRRNLRRLLLVGVPAGVLVLVSVAGERRWHEAPGAKAQLAFDEARSSLVDVPRVPTAKALTAAGWSLSDYEMAVRFGMYDEELYRTERIRAFVAAETQAPSIEKYARTARAYLLSRFHLICLASLLCVLSILGAPSAGAEGAPTSPVAARALIWAWIAAGTLALVVNRFPPRAFVPLYLYLGSLAILVPPPLPRVLSPRPASGLVRIFALGAVAAMFSLVMFFWFVDARAGRARLAADSRELAAGAGSIGPAAILVPVGPLLDTQYTGALAPAARRVVARMPPAGWAVSTPALGDFLRQAGFASGRAFMKGLVFDRRIVFVVRRPLLQEAQWLVESLNRRYAPDERLGIEPLGQPGGAPRFLFFRIRRVPEQG